MFPYKAETATELLAFVLCPARAFATRPGEAAEAARALKPVKAALVRRFVAARTQKLRS